MPEESPKKSALANAQTIINLIRDGLLLLLLVMLLLMPGQLNNILGKAGFTRASIFGFDWERKMENAVQETEAAKGEAQQLRDQLAVYSERLNRLANAVAEPTVKRQTRDLAREIQISESAAANLSGKLERNLAVQREIKTELRDHIVSRPVR